MHNSTRIWAGIMVLMLLLLQGCGRKGALFLPKDTPHPSHSDQKK